MTVWWDILIALVHILWTKFDITFLNYSINKSWMHEIENAIRRWQRFDKLKHWQITFSENLEHWHPDFTTFKWMKWKRTWNPSKNKNITQIFGYLDFSSVLLYVRRANWLYIFLHQNANSFCSFFLLSLTFRS